MSREAFALGFISQMSKNLDRLFYPLELLISHLSRYESLGLNVSRELLQYATGVRSAAEPSGTTLVNVTSHSHRAPRSSSWLSEVQFLKTLTRSTMINNLVIDTLEGQLITLFVVVAFILIFLIREWVVQQQPNLHGGAELNLGIVAGLNEDVAVVEEPAGGRPRARGEDGDVEAANMGGGILRQRRIARPRPRRPIAVRQDIEGGAEQGAEAPEVQLRDSRASESPQQPSSQEDTSHDGSSETNEITPQRPAMPDRTTIARAAEVRRMIEEQVRLAGDRDSQLKDFAELWAQSDQMP